MRIDPAWFVDERTLELVEMYLFFRPQPALAYQVPFRDQPDIWITAKILLDSVFPSLI